MSRLSIASFLGRRSGFRIVGVTSTESAFDVPDDRSYDREHDIWVHRDDSGRVRIGIDSFLLASLGELAYVALFDPGTVVARGHSIGTLEAAKMTTSITVPVSGIVTEINEAVLTDPQLINRDPYVEGWLIELDPTNWQQESQLLVAGEAIPAWVQEATKRLADEAENG